MKHARADYNRIQDPAGLIPADEPVFLLRAQDKLAYWAAKYYADMCEKNGAPEIADLARAHAVKMLEWPVKKVPDLPAAPAMATDLNSGDLMDAMHRDRAGS